MSIEKNIAGIEAMIRKGDVGSAQLAIKKMTHTVEIPRDLIFTLSSLARRSGLIQDALIMIKPLIANFKKDIERSNIDERIEYAANLIKVGMITEAQTWLDNIDALEHPAVLFQQAMLYLKNDNHLQAIPFLEEYVVHHKVNDYDRLEGEYKLAKCYLKNNEGSKAYPILKHVEKRAKKKNYLSLLSVSELIKKNDFRNILL